MTVFSRLVPTIASAYAFQTLCALIFVPQQNDKYYDLCGAIGWMSTTFVSLYFPSFKAKFWDGAPGSLPALSSFAPRQILLSAAVGIWSFRLGSFLAMAKKRAIKAEGDSRFDEIKKNPLKFSVFWFGQATWITLVGLPIWAVNALPARLNPTLGMRDYAAIGLYAGSLIFESIADRQKSAWRKARDSKKHHELFITSGLWGISRHPNYVGEVGIWTGIWALSTASLQSTSFPPGTALLAATSPFFTWYLLRKITGVPPLEQAGDRKFRENAQWQEYKKKVPVFWPWGSVA